MFVVLAVLAHPGSSIVPRPSCWWDGYEEGIGVNQYAVACESRGGMKDVIRLNGTSGARKWFLWLKENYIIHGSVYRSFDVDINRLRGSMDEEKCYR
jgi:hypothetical protein